jgi:hypothetical protein
MAHYAFINQHNVVVEVITGVDETETVNAITGTDGWEQFYATQRPGFVCRRTSYHGNIRKNFAGIGYTWDEQRDAFIPPQPFPSWTLNETTCLWDSPVPYPTDGNLYIWNEDTQQWDAAPTP